MGAAAEAGEFTGILSFYHLPQGPGGVGGASALRGGRLERSPRLGQGLDPAVGFIHELLRDGRSQGLR